ncbi:UNVERIFIED_CONTAM: hypothetical protein FKN15_020434 [Acipenser sinensis]
MDLFLKNKNDLVNVCFFIYKTCFSFRMLPGPLMTYQFQRSFIKAAKLDNQEARISEIHSIIHRLPEKNRQMLDLLMKHLAK